MDLASLRELLELAERHVEEGERHIRRQFAIANHLDRSGHTKSAELAWDLLRVLGDVQASHVAHRDRLKQQLASGG